MVVVAVVAAVVMVVVAVAVAVVAAADDTRIDGSWPMPLCLTARRL